MQYLGHIISEQGIATDPEKIKAIIDWPTPKSVTEVRSFIILLGYYRRFIEGFFKISYPITSLLKKNIKFNCNHKCETSFQRLQQLLKIAPILKVVDPFVHYVVFIDACKEGLGGVLMHNGHVIYYESRQLKDQ